MQFGLRHVRCFGETRSCKNCASHNLGGEKTVQANPPFWPYCVSRNRLPKVILPLISMLSPFG